MTFSFRAHDVREAFSIRLSTLGPEESRELAISIYNDEDDENPEALVSLKPCDALMLASVIAEMFRTNAYASE